jgi:hypothetical protein
MDNHMVLIFSILVDVIVIFQFFTRKGGLVHVWVGRASAVFAFALFASVIIRGYIRYDEPHGAMYPWHLATGSLFFVAMLFLTGSGIAMCSDLKRIRRTTLWRIHRISAWGTGLLMVCSLGLGLA